MAGKPVHVAFGGGRPTSDAGILLLVAAEQLADGILLARYALRHDPPLPVQGRRARYRDGNPHQARLLIGDPYQIRFATFARRIANCRREGGGDAQKKPSAQLQTQISRVPTQPKDSFKHRRHADARTRHERSRQA